jgi:hypothetical protein
MPQHQHLRRRHLPCIVEKLGEWSYTMFDERGLAVDEQEVQAARLAPR